MPRPRRIRKVGWEPDVYHFKPAGIGLKDIAEVTLTVDEYEAIRLKDFLQKNQAECAEEMDISQPTFHRILGEAHRKIAEAIVTGKALRIKGGDFVATGKGPGGYCICPSCRHKTEHERGVPCRTVACPGCGTHMRRY